MGKPILYSWPVSQAVRAVLLTARALDLELEIKTVDLMKGENFKEEYLKLNPLHTVPTLDDNGFVITDSHAIIVYLVEKYGPKNSPLYPTDDLEARTKINQLLHFDSNVLVGRLLTIAVPLFRYGATEIVERDVAYLGEAYAVLEGYLADRSYLVGDNYTLAEFSLGTTITQTSFVLPVDEAKYPNIVQWLKRLSDEIPFFDELNGDILKPVGNFYDAVLARNKANSQV